MKKCLCVLLLLLFVPVMAFGETLTLSFIGDCSIGEAIQNKGKENGYTWMLDQNGMDWPFTRLYHYLAEDDFTFANVMSVQGIQGKNSDGSLMVDENGNPVITSKNFGYATVSNDNSAFPQLPFQRLQNR